MAQALRLAERGLTTTQPNPRVACVIAQGDEVVGQGWHQRAGGAHAEVFALQSAGARARGATAYVTLEPCGLHGRTLRALARATRATTPLDIPPVRLRLPSTPVPALCWLVTL